MKKAIAKCPVCGEIIFQAEAANDTNYWLPVGDAIFTHLRTTHYMGIEEIISAAFVRVYDEEEQ